MNAQMNLNDVVTVRLTNYGVRILREHHLKLERTLNFKNPDRVPRQFVEPEHSMYTTQWWMLFEVFGNHVGIGKDIPFHLDLSTQVTVEEQKSAH